MINTITTQNNNKIRVLNTSKVEYNEQTCEWIIWVNHNKDFTFGSYYVLKKNGTVDFVIERFNDIHIEENI